MELWLPYQVQRAVYDMAEQELRSRRNQCEGLLVDAINKYDDITPSQGHEERTVLLIESDVQQMSRAAAALLARTLVGLCSRNSVSWVMKIPAFIRRHVSHASTSSAANWLE